MITPGISERSEEAMGLLPTELEEPHWYAAYTSANHEKCVTAQLELRAVEHFLPLYESVRRWKDRKMRLQLPLFPGYVFVRLPLRDRLKVLQIPGVARLVGFNGTPTPLAEEEIARLRLALGHGVRAEPHPYIAVGRRVRVIGGPMAGCEGILVRKKGNLRIVLSLDLIQRSVMLDVDGLDVEPVLTSWKSGGRRGEAVA